jgi:hypothetical protein
MMNGELLMVRLIVSYSNGTFTSKTIILDLSFMFIHHITGGRCWV